LFCIYFNTPQRQSQGFRDIKEISHKKEDNLCDPTALTKAKKDSSYTLLGGKTILFLSKMSTIVFVFSSLHHFQLRNNGIAHLGGGGRSAEIRR
jgi:hypothetical protein